jgi:hypothetical protein
MIGGFDGKSTQAPKTCTECKGYKKIECMTCGGDGTVSG